MTEKKEVSLKRWLLNHTGADTAAQCRCSRVAIHRASKTDRKIKLLVQGDKILDAYEIKNKVRVFGFK